MATKQEKYELFRGQTMQLLTLDEAKAVKEALHAFVKSKDIGALVAVLNEHLNTKEKRVLLATIRSLVPAKYQEQLTGGTALPASDEQERDDAEDPPQPQPPAAGIAYGFGGLQQGEEVGAAAATEAGDKQHLRSLDDSGIGLGEEELEAETLGAATATAAATEGEGEDEGEDEVLAPLPTSSPGGAAAAASPASDLMRGRKGSVMGRQGGVHALIRRASSGDFAGADIQPEPSRNTAGVDTSGVFRSRKGSVMGSAGAVGQHKRGFIRKADRLTRPQNLAEKLEEAEAAAAEKSGGKIVVYTSSVTAVKAQFSQCQEVLRMMQNHRVLFEERDMVMTTAFQEELASRAPGQQLPIVFLNGKLLGGHKEMLRLNEEGGLALKLQRVPRIADNERGECGQCGGRRFYLCLWCGGDKRSMSSRLGREIVSLKCTACNENGLMKCTACMILVP